MASEDDHRRRRGRSNNCLAMWWSNKFYRLVIIAACAVMLVWAFDIDWEVYVFGNPPELPAPPNWAADPPVPLVRHSDAVPRCSPIDFRGKKVCAPSFFIVGQEKCGSTALYSGLTQHPDVAPAVQKELKWFPDQYDKFGDAIEPYLGLYPSLPLNVTTGEGSPTYFRHPNSAPQIKHHFPHAKIIMALRDPVERAWSAWDMALRLGWAQNRADFSFNVHYEIRRLRNCVSRLGRDADYRKLFECYNFWPNYNMVSQGQYAEVVKYWQSIFPPDQLLILKAEDFFASPEKQLAIITDFLGLQPYDWSNAVLMQNTGDHSEKMRPADRAVLVEYFKPYNDDLVALLGPEFNFNKPTVVV